MVFKRQVLRQGAEEGSQLPIKRRHLASTIFKGVDYGRTLQDSMPCLEPIIRKWVQEAVDRAMLRSSCDQINCSVAKNLQLKIHSNLPETLFTGNRLLSEDRSPIKVVLFDTISKGIVTSGPLSSLKVSIVVVHGDFGRDDQEDWTTDEFDSKLVKNREGKRPLMAGESMVMLEDGVGCIGQLSFTDNSSWIRSGKFRLGARAKTGDDISIREGVSNSFRVKDHRGESYQKHYPPSLDDEVWRLEKIAKDGASHKKLNQFGIFCVRDFLRLYITDQLTLRAILKVSNKTWGTIMGHATTCNIDDNNNNKYMYTTAQGIGLLFNSIYKVVGVAFDGKIFQPLNTLNSYQMMMVEDLKQHAYKNQTDWVSVSDAQIAGYPMLHPVPDTFRNPNFGISFQEHGQHETVINIVPPTISPPYKTEEEQDNCSFELRQSSHTIQGLNIASGDSFAITDSPAGFCLGGQLSTDDLPIDDNFQVEFSSAWQGNGFFLDRGNHETGIISSNSGILIPPSRNGRSKSRWCKVLAVVKWQILFRRNVAARKWKSFSYM